MLLNWAPFLQDILQLSQALFLQGVKWICLGRKQDFGVSDAGRVWIR